jgi:hypothetical protein
VLADGWTAHATVHAPSLRPCRTPLWLRESLAAVQPSPTVKPAGGD